MSVVHDAGKRLATISIAWASFSNEDMEEGAGPHEGWYVDVDTGQTVGSIGPDFYGPGFQTLDEAIAAVRKWANGRRLQVNTETFILGVFQQREGD